VPVYEYQCKNGHLYEEVLSIKEYKPNKTVKCPECKCKMERYFGDPPLGFVRGEATTLGQLGERNFKALGKIKGEEMMEERKKSEDESCKRVGGITKEEYRKVRKLASLNKDQKRRYIHTGKLPP